MKNTKQNTGNISMKLHQIQKRTIKAANLQSENFPQIQETLIIN